MIRFEHCKHPPAKHKEVGDPHCFSHPVAIEPFTHENPAAHGNIRVEVECTACGGRRSENVNQNHIEVSPWTDHRGDEERERRLQIHRNEQAKAELDQQTGAIRRAYGERPDICIDDDGTCVLSWPGRLKVVIGTSLTDAVRRTGTQEAEVIRDAIAGRGL